MKALKWFGIAVGSLLSLFAAAAVVIPLIVDVDKFRPEIVQAANQQLNGKLDIGKLSLSLWGQIRIQMDGVDLKDSAGRTVVSVKDAFFHLPLLSVLSGSPEMIFKMEQPRISVIKYKSGKFNAMSLLKQSGESAPVSGAKTAPPASPSNIGAGEPIKLPALAANARLGIEMSGALVEYSDEGSGLKSEVKDLNLVIKDISLSRTMDLELWADLDTAMGRTFGVKGPARITAHVRPGIAGGVFDHATVDARIDLDGLDLSSGTVFHKSPGMAASADFSATASGKEAKIEHFDIKFFNAEIKASGTITNLGGGGPPVAHLTVASNDIELKSWNQLVPMLKDFDLAGNAKLEAEAEGPSDKLGYKARFAVTGLTAKAPQLKEEPRIDLAVQVETDELQSVVLTLKAPGNELAFKGKLVHFDKPQGTFQLSSTGLDLDQLIKWPAAPDQGGTKTEAQPSEKTEAGSGSALPASNLDASLDSLRTNPKALAATVLLGFDIKMLQAQGIRMGDMSGKLYFKDMTAGLEGFAMKIWDGTVKANLAAQLKPKQPTYTLGLLLDGLDLQKAVEANVQAVKNTLVGKLHFDLNGSGASLNPDPAKTNLKAKGSFKVDHAVFATVDVTKMATDGINKALEKVADKIPQARGKSVGNANSKESKYDWVSSNFTIDGGKFRMPDFATKASPNEGIDLKGTVEVGLKDYSLNTAWEVIDTYDLTGARALSVQVAGKNVDHLLAEGSGPVKFPVHAGCTCLKPCYSYAEAPEYLAKVASGNVTAAAGAEAKAQLQSKVQSVVPKSAPPAAQSAVQNLGNKFFH